MKTESEGPRPSAAPSRLNPANTSLAGTLPSSLRSGKPATAGLYLQGQRNAQELTLLPTVLGKLRSIKSHNRDFLDVGCGDGLLAQTLAKAYMPRTVTLGEFDAQERAQAAKLWGESATCLPLDLRYDLNFGGRFFGAITSINVLMYLSPDNLRRALGNIAKLLDRGGKFIAADVHPDWMELQYPRAEVRDSVEEHARIADWKGSKPQVWFRSLSRLEAALEQSGLTYSLESLAIPQDSGLAARYSEHAGTHLHVLYTLERKM